MGIITGFPTSLAMWLVIKAVGSESSGLCLQGPTPIKRPMYAPGSSTLFRSGSCMERVFCCSKVFFGPSNERGKMR